MLFWLSEQIGKGTIAISRVANHSGGPEAVTEWLRNFAFVIPAPLHPHPSELTEFAAFFSTYLTSSFDVVAKPGTRGEGPTGICGCPICVRIVNAPHLQAKKLTAGDKRRADFLMTESLLSLAKEQAYFLSEDDAEQIVLAKQTRRACAYLAYGEWLIRRLAGESDGPAILVLWRLIAWDPRGGMIRGFKLTLDDFVTAEQALGQQIAQQQNNRRSEENPRLDQ
ncbi:hypothetical protein ETAA8_44810 [Anatilimnocola aggregata]|uniref:Uncharacterized protein n=1 Tax=Anatilimnocola aggregata TaxID=2528021 RepID=A0A517YGP6_9BACT|nr:hypothetical protein [Anatilimnocola aggregata]QDU29372.1 hypothetical protein ETAA8_44810 [Anatilimnocola aggregata]